MLSSMVSPERPTSTDISRRQPPGDICDRMNGKTTLPESRGRHRDRAGRNEGAEGDAESSARTDISGERELARGWLCHRAGAADQPPAESGVDGVRSELHSQMGRSCGRRGRTRKVGGAHRDGNASTGYGGHGSALHQQTSRTLISAVAYIC